MSIERLLLALEAENIAIERMYTLRYVCSCEWGKLRRKKQLSLRMNYVKTIFQQIWIIQIAK